MPSSIANNKNSLYFTTLGCGATQMDVLEILGNERLNGEFVFCVNIFYYSFEKKI